MEYSISKVVLERNRAIVFRQCICLGSLIILLRCGGEPKPHFGVLWQRIIEFFGSMMMTFIAYEEELLAWDCFQYRLKLFALKGPIDNYDTAKLECSRTIEQCIFGKGFPPKIDSPVTRNCRDSKPLCLREPLVTQTLVRDRYDNE